MDPGIEYLSLVASSGDFVYFSPGWIHCVWTHEKSLGIGGYIQPKGARSEMLHAVAFVSLRDNVDLSNAH